MAANQNYLEGDELEQAEMVMGVQAQLPGGAAMDIQSEQLPSMPYLPGPVGRPMSAFPTALARADTAMGAEQQGLAGLQHALMPTPLEAYGAQLVGDAPTVSPQQIQAFNLAASTASPNIYQGQGLDTVAQMSTASPYQHLAASRAMQAAGAPLLPREWGQTIEPGLADTYLQGQQELMSGLKTTEQERMADVIKSLTEQSQEISGLGRQDLLNRMAQQYGPQAFTSGMGFELERRQNEAMQRNLFQAISQTGLEGSRQLAGMQQQGLLQTLGQLPGQLAQGRQAAALQQMGTRLPAAQLMGQLGGQMWQQPLQQGSALTQLGGLLPQQQLQAATAAAPMAAQMWQQPLSLAQLSRDYGAGTRHLGAGISQQLFGSAMASQQQQIRAAQAAAAQAEQTRQIQDLSRQRAFEEWRQRQQLFAMEPWQRLSQIAQLYRPSVQQPVFQPSAFAQMAPALPKAIQALTPLLGGLGGGQGNAPVQQASVMMPAGNPSHGGNW